MGLFGDADLVMTKDVAYVRSLKYLINAVAINWTLYTVVSQVRDRDATLFFDLTPYLAVNSGDHTQLVLTIPRAVIQTIPSDLKWDLVATLISDTTQTFRTPQPAGRLIVMQGITDIA